MEVMDKNVCLDSDVVIGLMKGDPQAVSLIERLQHSTMHITSISSFELSLRETRLSVIEDFINNVIVLPFDLAASKKASEIFKQLKRSGKMIELRDVFIAATCITHRCTLMTFNRKHFEHIKEIRVLQQKA
ncbi:MAG: hypothetical protein QS99_C0011G0025 [archaeon GW2011_AR4]|nr:MAG: hypothetical protein QS99_C0011G0025 [archaeon GW2011_AR4]